MALALFHGSHDPELTEIRAWHFGEVDFGGLFMSTSKRAAESHGAHVYTAELDSDDIADTRELRLWEAEIAALELDATDDDIEAAVEDSGESWECQILRGEIARRLGFAAVEMSDEHGTSYLVFSGATIKPAE